MNMKKLMAVVLAVVIAVSAMAINVFAAEAETWKINLASSYANASTKTVTWTFDVNVYNLYGYANYNNYLELRLPATLARADKLDTIADTAWPNYYMTNWYIEVNGVKTQIKGVSDKPWDSNDGINTATLEAGFGNAKYFTQYVNFGAFTRPYYVDANGVEQWATIAQSSMVGDINTIRLVAETTFKTVNGKLEDNTYDTGDWDNNTFRRNNYDMYVQMCEAVNGVKDYGNDRVVGSATPAAFMVMSKSANDNDNGKSNVDFLSTPEKEDAKVWDHTLENRAYIMGAESAKVVVKLAKAIDCFAIYTLHAVDQNGTSYDTWQTGAWQQYDPNANIKATSICLVNGTTDELVFDVPKSVLYNSTYGLFNYSFSVTEDYTMDAVAWRRLNGKADWQNPTVVSTGDNGNMIKTTDMYILLTMPATADEPSSDDLTVNEPQEPGDVDELPEEPGDITVNEPKDEPKEEKNPHTGVVLAVLPMVVAAFAVVSSKKR